MFSLVIIQFGAPGANLPGAYWEVFSYMAVISSFNVNIRMCCGNLGTTTDTVTQ